MLVVPESVIVFHERLTFFSCGRHILGNAKVAWDEMFQVRIGDVSC